MWSIIQLLPKHGRYKVFDSMAFLHHFQLTNYANNNYRDDTTSTNAIVNLDMSARYALRNSVTCTNLHIIVNQKLVTKFIYLFKLKWIASVSDMFRNNSAFEWHENCITWIGFSQSIILLNYWTLDADLMSALIHFSVCQLVNLSWLSSLVV